MSIASMMLLRLFIVLSGMNSVTGIWNSANQPFTVKLALNKDKRLNERCMMYLSNAETIAPLYAFCYRRALADIKRKR